MAIPQYFLQELKSRIGIEDVISSYVNLKRRGKNLLGLCPFHNEKTPSFNVSTDNAFFHCFGCGAGGDVITFVMKIENLDYVEAIKFLADRAGIQVPESTVDNSMSQLRSRVLEINRETAKFFHNTLMSDEGKVALDYLLNRSISPKMIRHFGLGYSPSGGFELLNHLQKLGYKNDEIVAANVASMSQKNKPYDRFRERVMFPIIDLRGNVIAFGGRTMGKDSAKYINSSDTPVYKKSTGLFAMNFAKNNTDNIILVEGYMDVIALHQAGFRGAVASLGTALAKEQARVISKYTSDVVICYDSDDAGKKATDRAIPILKNEGLRVRVLNIPNGKDPDEFLQTNGKDGPLKFKALLDKCNNDVEYRMWLVRKQHDLETDQGKVEYLTSCVNILGSIENSIERDVYTGKLSQETGVDKASISAQVKKILSKNAKTKEQLMTREQQKNLSGAGDRINPDKSKNLKAANAEEALISYIFTNPDALDYCKQLISPENFVTNFGKRVYTVIFGKNIESQAITLSDISQDLSREEIEALSRILMKNSEVMIKKEDAKEYIEVLRQESIFSDTDTIKNASAQEIADYLKNLKNRKK